MMSPSTSSDEESCLNPKGETYGSMRKSYMDDPLKSSIDKNKNPSNKLESNVLEGDLPPPPDGGWGWVVVAASFFCLCVLDGISYTFGMFLAPLMEDMECGRSGVSAAGSLQVVSRYFAIETCEITNYNFSDCCLLPY